MLKVINLMIVALFLMAPTINAFEICESKLDGNEDVYSEEDFERDEWYEEDFAIQKHQESVATPKELKTVADITNGIMRIIRIRNGGVWWMCGVKLEGEEKQDTAMEIAWQLVMQLQSIGGVEISPWGILATMYNESNFDACAIGKHPRKWAYDNGLLVGKKLTVSHTVDELHSFMINERTIERHKYTGIDLGVCQILSKYYKGEETELISNVGGIRICILEMQQRAVARNTKTPWLYWKSFAGVEWYRQRIIKWAKIMGAPDREIKKL